MFLLLPTRGETLSLSVIVISVNTCKTLEICGRDLILPEVVYRIEGVFKFNPKWKFFSCTAQRSRYFCVISQIILIE